MLKLSAETEAELVKEADSQAAAVGPIGQVLSSPTPSETVQPETGGGSQTAATPSSSPPATPGAACAAKATRRSSTSLHSPPVNAASPTLPVQLPDNSLGGQSTGTGEKGGRRAHYEADKKQEVMRGRMLMVGGVDMSTPTWLAGKFVQRRALQ